MLKLRTDTVYVGAGGKFTQAGVEAIQGQLDSIGTSLGARVTTLESYSRRVLLATRTASASATLDFTEFNNAVYSRYLFTLDAVKPATDATTLLMRFSTDGGSTYDAGAADYSYANSVLASGGALTASTSAGATGIALTFPNDTGNAAGEDGASGDLVLINAADGAIKTRTMFNGSYDNTSSIFVAVEVRARRNTAQDTTAVRFLYSSGNVASGVIRMYGLT